MITIIVVWVILVGVALILLRAARRGDVAMKHAHSEQPVASTEAESDESDS